MKRIEIKSMMKTQLVNGIKVTIGAANIFADLGLQEALIPKIMTGLIVKIIKAMWGKELTQQEATKHMGINEPKIS